MQQFDVVKGKSATTAHDHRPMDCSIAAMSRVLGSCRPTATSALAQRMPRGRTAGLRLRHGQNAGPFQQPARAFFDVGALAMMTRSSSSSPGAAGTRPVVRSCSGSGRRVQSLEARRGRLHPAVGAGQRAKRCRASPRATSATRAYRPDRAVPNFEVKAGDDGRLLVRCGSCR